MKLVIYNQLWKSIVLLFVFLLISCIPVTPLTQDRPAPSLQSTTLNQTPSISPTYRPLPRLSKTPPAEPISAELGTLGWISHTSLPVKSFQKFWDIGYNILSIAYGDGLWVATLNKQNDFNDQKILVSVTFPEKDIEEAKRSRYYVTNLAYGDGLWAIVLSNTDEINDQVVKVDTVFSQDETDQMTEDGYWLTIEV